MLAEPAGHPAKLGVQLLPVVDVALERLLRRDRDALDLGIEPPFVDPTGAIAEHRSHLSREQPPQRVVVEIGEPADGGQAGGPQTLLRPRADAGQQSNVEGRQEGSLAARADDREPAGLAPVGGDLRDHLAGGDAERAGERGRAPDRRLHRLGELAGGQKVAGDLSEVEVALVDPGLLDRRDDLAHRAPDRPRVVAVEAVARPDEDGVRTAAQCLGAAHRRVDAVLTGDVVRGRDHAAALGVAADHERLGRSDGSSSCSTAAKKASRSRCATIIATRVEIGTEPTHDRAWIRGTIAEGKGVHSPTLGGGWTGRGKCESDVGRRHAPRRPAMCTDAGQRSGRASATSIASVRGVRRRSGCPARLRDGRRPPSTGCCATRPPTSSARPATGCGSCARSSATRRRSGRPAEVESRPTSPRSATTPGSPSSPR